MEFLEVAPHLNINKSYKRIEVKSQLVSALLSMNDEHDQQVKVFAQRNEVLTERGVGTTEEGLERDSSGEFVTDM